MFGLLRWCLVLVLVVVDDHWPLIAAALLWLVGALAVLNCEGVL